jgi:hypothetical protein
MLTFFAEPASAPSPEKRPPDAASKMVTIKVSPTPMRRSAAPPPTPNDDEKLSNSFAASRSASCGVRGMTSKEGAAARDCETIALAPGPEAGKAPQAASKGRTAKRNRKRIAMISRPVGTR